MKKVFVLGSNSFSGSSYIDYLLSNGYQVKGCSRSQEYPDVFLPYYRNKKIKNYAFHRLDINNHIEEIVELIDEYKPHFIVNYMAQGMVAESWLNPLDWYETNLLSQVKLHESIRNFEFIEKYLHFTTPEVYGSISGWTKENNVFAPNSPYAVSRAACDLHLLSFFNNYSFPVVFTRAANVFGAHQQLYRIVPQTIIRALRNENLELHGGGLSERSFIHINDVSRATEMVMLNGVIGETYHISTESKITIRDLVNQICSLLGVNFDKLVIETDERLGKDYSYSLDSSKIRSELNWSDLISLEEGIIETIDWIKSNFEILSKQSLSYNHKK